MNKFLEISHWKTRPLIYSFLISCGLTILIFFLESISETWFILGSLIVYLLILVELYSTANHYHVKHRKNSKSVYEFESHKTVQFTHHLFMPTLLYLAIIGFLFFNRFAGIYFLSVIGGFALFGVLLENIHSFYKHEFSLNKSTNYVYDLLSVVLSFLFTNVLIHFVEFNELPESVLILSFAVFMFLQSILLVLRHTIDVPSIFINMVVNIGLLILFYFLTINYESANLIAFIISLVFQTYTLFVNQYTDGKITRENILEYAISMMLIFSILNFYVG
jgi:hypothetical protein